MSSNKLIEEAINVRKNAYVPYSKFPVGAALLTKSGKVYTGCNIENAAYTVGCCAERVTIFKAISDGETAFVEMAVAADTKRPVPPCGACRQVMSEFFSNEIQIHLTNLSKETKTFRMDELLPFSFNNDDLLKNE
ncbi:cytidine deaminase [Oceanobacillus bengalensis]|uniref:Cytidine deaminase n=1 Tax=Oceanobacillus bengalensis TaxID=1435466 RepID=A0A494YUT9_9BACI|nr:cytidine deaminase [Oceanobacillus bengalensis]RKQ13921.1 cytidine deaminase [Oceanobacillus bengalensis]